MGMNYEDVLVELQEGALSGAGVLIFEGYLVRAFSTFLKIKI